MLITANWILKLFNRFATFKINAIALFPFIVIGKTSRVDEVVLNHERIHLRQQIELLIIPFYIIYLCEGMFKKYRDISFEREAFANEKDPDYLRQRRSFAFLKYWRR